MTEKEKEAVAVGKVSNVPSYNQHYHVKQVLERVDLDRAVLSKTACKFIMEHFERCKLGQYVDKIDSDREGVNVYVDLKAEHRKSGNAFVVDVNYFRKKSLKGGVPYFFVRDTKQLAPMLPHPFLVSEDVNIYKMKDEVAAVKELAKIQVFYCFYYAAAVCNRVEDEFYWGSEDVDEDWHAIIREAFFRYMAHRLHKIPAHMNQEDYDWLKEIAMSPKNSEERKFLGLSFNHKR